jgi:hypothetical protein
LCLAALVSAKVYACSRETVVDVAVLYLVVDVDIIGVEDLWVVEWWKNWLLKRIGEVWVFIWRLESSDTGL